MFKSSNPNLPNQVACLGVNAVAIFIAVWLVIGYILPNTGLELLSARNVWFVILRQSSIVQWNIFTEILSISVLVSYFSFFSRSADHRTLIAAISIYFAFNYVSIWKGGASHEYSDGANITLTIAMGLAAARILGNPRVMAKVIFCLVLLQALFTLYYAATGSDHFISGHIIRAGGSFGNPTSLYPVLLVGIPIVFNLAANEKKTVVKTAYYISFCVIFLSLVLTYYRGGIIAVGLALSFIAHRYSSRSIWLTTALLLICVSGVFFVRNSDRASMDSSNRSAEGREQLCAAGWQNFRLHWLTGVGANNVSLRIPKNQSPTVTYPHPYNLYLFWLDEFGIGAIPLFGASALAMIRIFRRSTEPEVAVGYEAAWCAILFAGLFDVPFFIGRSGYEAGNALVGILLGTPLLLSQTLRSSDRIDSLPQNFD